MDSADIPEDMAGLPAKQKEYKVELQELKVEIETIKDELGKLIDSNADFQEIYETSLRLDKLIVAFQKYSCNANFRKA